MSNQQSTSSTDKLLTGSSTSVKGHPRDTRIGPVLLHSLTPHSLRSGRNPYQPTTVPYRSKYDKVSTSDSTTKLLEPPRHLKSTSEPKTSFHAKYDKVSSSDSSCALLMMDNRHEMEELPSQVQQNMRHEYSRQSSLGDKVGCGNTTIQCGDDDSPQDGSSKSSIAPQVMAALCLSLGSMVAGFVSGYTSPTGESMKESAALGDISITEDDISWIGSVMPLAALVGGIMGGPFIDFFGRQKTILLTAVPFIASFLLIALAPNVLFILAGRITAGFCVGIASLSLPVYLGETIQPQVRGTLGLLPTAFGNTGILIVFTAGKYLSWRYLAYLGAAIPIPFFILSWFIPETPRWFASKGDVVKAERSLQWLRGKDANIKAELSEIERSISSGKDSEGESAIRSILSPSCFRPLCILIGLMLFQQMSGINAVIFYTVTIFKDAGSTIDKNLCTIIVGIVNFLSTFIATTLIDRMGRKMLLYISAVSMSLTLTVLGVFFYLQKTDMDLSTYGWVPLVSFVIYVVGFSLGFGPIPWLMMGEILPAKVRGPAASITTAFNWSCTFLVTKTFGDLIKVLGNDGAFGMFALICLTAVFFVAFFVPETKGKSLEDIERKLNKGRRMSSVANLKPTPLGV